MGRNITVAVISLCETKIIPLYLKFSGGIQLFWNFSESREIPSVGPDHYKDKQRNCTILQISRGSEPSPLKEGGGRKVNT